MASSNGEPVLPVFDLSTFISEQDSAFTAEQLEICHQVANCLHQTGCLVIRDPRVGSEDNEHFLCLMERYFSQPLEVKLADARPHLHYQVGATPSGVEVPRCLVDTGMKDQIQHLPENNKATMPGGPDLKWRYMWRVGPRPSDTKFPELNAEPVIPKAFPEWASVMDNWGRKMQEAAEAAATVAAVGLGLPRDAFSRLMHNGPHLLAPTGSDLSIHNKLGTVFAGIHYDLNFLTIHGKSRFPGLFVWLRDGRRVPVRIPDGCLFIQAGKQLEWLTGGHVMAGLHEVVVTEDTLKAVEAAKAAGRSCWRVSSTVFMHVASDQVLQPLGGFANQEACLKYPAMPAGQQVQQELEMINLKANGSL